MSKLVNFIFGVFGGTANEIGRVNDGELGSKSRELW